MNILGTGLTGLVGSRIIELLHDNQYENLSLETGIDITNAETVHSLFSKSNAPWVWHFAAMTNVDLAEQDRAKGENSIFWNVNVKATQTIATACKKFGKKLLYLSTDYVFDGSKDTYYENDEPRPQGWYAITKFEGEKIVSQLGDQAIIVRIANPYKAKQEGKPDFVETIYKRLASGQSVSAPTDQLFVPTYIDDIAYAIQLLMDKSLSGVYHVVGSQALSPYDVCFRIATTFGFSTELIQKTTFEKFFSGRAPRPFHAVLNNDKITKLGITLKTFDEGIKIVKNEGNHI